MFPTFLTGSKQWTHILPTIFANFLWLNLGTICSNCLAVCTRTHFWSFVNICVIHLKKKIRTFKTRFKMKKRQQLFQFHEWCIYHYFYLFPWLLKHLSYLFGQILPYLWWSLLPVKKVLLHPQTISLDTLSDTKTSPYFLKNLHYRMTELCAKFYIRSNFFNTLNPFSTIFTTVVNA